MVTAAQAIKRECRFCINASQEKCMTKICALHPGVSELRSSVKKIKTHCMECAIRDLSGSVHQAVLDCGGQILRENGNTALWIDQDGRERGVCWLHPFRLGRNPDRRKMSPETREKRSESMAKLRARPVREGRFCLQDRRSKGKVDLGTVAGSRKPGKLTDGSSRRGGG
jgi:hypothetical protein